MATTTSPTTISNSNINNNHEVSPFLFTTNKSIFSPLSLSSSTTIIIKKTHLYTAFSSLVAMTSRHKQPSPDQRPQQHPNSTKDDGGDQ
jgi:hypothetical protein